MDVLLPAVFTRAQARTAGLEETQMRAMLRRGELVVLRQGVYCAATTAEALQRFARGPLVLQVRAAQSRLRTPTWASELTAARLHGLALPLEDHSGLTLVCEPGRGSSRTYDGVRVLPARVGDDDRTEVLGTPCLSVPRTVVDVARMHPLSTALIVGDDALRRGTERSDIAAALERCAGMPGIRAARLAVRHLDGRRETPLESESYAFFVVAGLPLPEPQVWLGRDRVDFYWRRARLVGEADGKVKYSTGLGADNGEGDALWKEKGRAGRLEDLGESVVRWTYADLRQRREQLEHRLRHHLGGLC